MDNDINPITAAFAEFSMPDAPAPQSTEVPVVNPETVGKEPSSQSSGVADLMKMFDPTFSADPEPGQVSADTPQTMQQAQDEPSAAPTSQTAAADELPEQIDSDPKAQARWGELRKRLKEAEQQLQAYSETPVASQNEQALQALEAKAAEQERLIQEYEASLRVSRIESTQEYQAIVEQPLSAVIDAVEQLAAKYNVDQDRLVEAIGAPVDQQDALFDDLVENFSQRDRMRLFGLADSAQEIFAAEQRIRQEAAQSVVELDAREAAARQQAEAQRALEFRQANQKMIGIAAEKLKPFGIDMSAVQPAIESTRLDTAGMTDQAYAAVAMAVLPQMMERFAAQQQELAKAKQALAGYLQAAPVTSAASQDQQALPTNNLVLKAIGAFG